jgi:hypothetical protein
VARQTVVIDLPVFVTIDTVIHIDDIHGRSIGRRREFFHFAVATIAADLAQGDMAEMRKVDVPGKNIYPLPAEFLVGFKNGYKFLFFRRFPKGFAVASQANILSRQSRFPAGINVLMAISAFHSVFRDVLIVTEFHRLRQPAVNRRARGKQPGQNQEYQFSFFKRHSPAF